MAARLVVHDSVAEPDHAVDPEMVTQPALDLGSRQRRVAVRVQQALLGGEHRAFAVDVDRSTFEHERRPVADVAVVIEHPRGDRVVLVPRVVEPAPRVEQPVDPTSVALGVDDERRPDVAHPRVVARHRHHLDRVRERGARHIAQGRRDSHPDVLTRRNRRGDCSERGLRGRAAVAPRVAPVRPEHPAALVRSPLRRHVEAVGARRRLEAGHSSVEPLWRMSLATRAVQPVWWAAPSPFPESPWKYSKKVTWSRQ